MKKRYPVFLFLLFLCMETGFVFAINEDVPDLDVPAPEEKGNTAVRILIGGVETLLSNGIILTYNLLYNINTDFSEEGRNWTVPTAEALRVNFTEPWQWEEFDGFKVNQFAHPYQGSTYFSAGRVNGFGFYESVSFSVFGSFTWETLFENNLASMNDFITTVAGSVPMGEILYRLYLEACAAGVPALLAAVINPIAGFHRLITRWKPPDYGRNIRQFQVRLGSGYVQTDFTLSPGNDKMYSFRGPIAETEFVIVYGNPFEQKSTTPFDHFEFSFFFGLDFVNYIDIRFISEGYLFSFSPVYTDTDTMSTGLSLHMDFVSLGEYSMYDSTIDQYSNALNWTVKYQHLFPQNFIFQMKAHAGITFFGVSEYYSPEIQSLQIDIKKNYGGGLNGKLFFNFEHEKFGKLETGIFGYVLWTYPGTSALTRGTVYWLFTDVTYSFNISKHLSLGITDSFALERGFFDKSGFPNTVKSNNAVKMFIAWNL